MSVCACVCAVPPPIVTITRLPASPTRLYTGDSLTLTCVIKLHSTVDTPISTHTSWSGNAALSDSPRVTVTAASSSPPYNSLVTFSSLKSSDTGNYVCSAQVLPQVIPNQVPYIVESTIVNHSINIAACEYNKFVFTIIIVCTAYMSFS